MAGAPNKVRQPLLQSVVPVFFVGEDLTGGGIDLPLCEVEVELKAGDRQIAMQYAANLAIAYGLETESRSKFRRSLALAKGE